MPTPRAFVVGLAVALSCTIAAACTSTSTPAAPAGDPVLVEGQKVYTSNCASCHGAAGQGGYGKKLAGVVETRFPDIADEIELIANGKGGMPGFSQKLTAEQIEAVARYTREVL